MLFCKLCNCTYDIKEDSLCPKCNECGLIRVHEAFIELIKQLKNKRYVLAELSFGTIDNPFVEFVFPEYYPNDLVKTSPKNLLKLYQMGELRYEKIYLLI